MLAGRTVSRHMAQQSAVMMSFEMINLVMLMISACRQRPNSLPLFASVPQISSWCVIVSGSEKSNPVYRLYPTTAPETVKK